MSQQNTSIPSKNTGEQLSSSEFNDLNTVVNSNSSDAEPRLSNFESSSAANDSSLTTVEGTDSGYVQKYSTPNLPTGLNNGVMAYDTSSEIPVYTKSSLWYRASDDVALNSLTEVDLFLVMGQSNADGKADINNLDPAKAGLNRSDIQMYASSANNTPTFIPGTWGVMNPGTNTAQAGNRFGPEVGFADSVKAIVDGGGNAYYSNPVAILKFAKGSTKLSTDWDSNNANNFMYDGMVKAIPDGKFSLGQAGFRFNIKGLIWYQGESDAFNQTDADNYEDNLNALFADIRTRLLVPNLPIIICKIDYAANPPTYLTEVRAALQAVSDADSNIDIVDTSGLGRRDDVHLNATGMYSLGESIATEFTNLL
jgi:hypothetical protein